MRGLHRIVYKDHFSSFEERFLKTNLSQSMKEISKTLATEMYKTLKSLSPEIMKDIFKTKNNHYNTLNALIFPKEMLKQLDMDYRPCLKWVL